MLRLGMRQRRAIEKALTVIMDDLAHLRHNSMQDSDLLPEPERSSACDSRPSIDKAVLE
jgi:hypothetical protein